MQKKRGRPKKIDSKTDGYRLRMSKEERYLLEKICQNEGLSKADVFRALIKIGYDMSKNGSFIGYPENRNDDYGIIGYPENEDNFEDDL